jgi:conjugative transfer pilus assembly protein TraH
MRKNYGGEATAKGLLTLLDSNTGSNGAKPIKDAKAAGITKKCYDDVNLLWCELNEAKIGTWFVDADDELLNTIMALTGSYIVGEAVEAEDGEGESPELRPVAGGNVTVSQMLKGGDLRIYNCSGPTSKCLDPKLVTTNVVGISTRISNMLLGQVANAATGVVASAGIISKFELNSGELTTQERNFLSNLNHGMGAMIRNLSAVDGNAARDFASLAAPYMALDMLKVVMNSLLQAAVTTASVNQSPFADKLNINIRDARQSIENQLADVRVKYGSQLEIRSYYANLMSNVRHKRYVLNIINAGQKPLTVGSE